MLMSFKNSNLKPRESFYTQYFSTDKYLNIPPQVFFGEYNNNHLHFMPKIKYVCSNGLGTISEISQKINFIRQELSFSFSDFSKYDNIDFKKSSIMSKILTTNEEKSCLKNPYLFGNSKTRKSGFGLLYPTHHYNKKNP